MQYLLQGSVRKAGSRIRITGQLIEAAAGHHVWADRFDGELEDVFDLQDRVTANVVGIIEPKLKEVEIERARKKPTENLIAYDLYLRALWHQGLVTRDGLDEALRLCYAALSLDPTYSSALGLAAWCYIWRRAHGWAASVDEEAAEGARLARAALSVERDDPTVLAYAGQALAFLERDYDAAISTVERALVLNPNSALAWNISGWNRLYVAQPQKAISCFEVAQRLSPLDPLTGMIQAGIAYAHAFLGEWDNAVRVASRAIEETPNATFGWRPLIAGLVWTDRLEKARVAARKMLRLQPNFSITGQRATAPFRDVHGHERLIEAYRLAGLPE